MAPRREAKEAGKELQKLVRSVSEENRGADGTSWDLLGSGRWVIGAEWETTVVTMLVLFVVFNSV